MQTILGSGGAIGVELASILPRYTSEIRLVSRQPKPVNASDHLLAADLTRPDAVMDAVEGSDVVYVTVGFPYSARVWQATWPPFMQHVIAACKTHKARLVFFDNIYMYNPAYLNRMNEETPDGPVSTKGKVRKQVADMILREIERGNLQALIARSADFYGPSIEANSVLTETVFKNLSVGKKANWLGSLKYKHAFTYTPDAGKATALLGNTEDAYNQVWHLPTAADPPTGAQWIEMIAREMGVEPRYQVAPKWMVRLMGLFMPTMKELVEMMYQYENDYVFDSTKFETRFDVHPTSYEDGIRETVATDYAS